MAQGSRLADSCVRCRPASALGWAEHRKSQPGCLLWFGWFSGHTGQAVSVPLLHSSGCISPIPPQTSWEHREEPAESTSATPQSFISMSLREFTQDNVIYVRQQIKCTYLKTRQSKDQNPQTNMFIYLWIGISTSASMNTAVNPRLSTSRGSDLEAYLHQQCWTRHLIMGDWLHSKSEQPKQQAWHFTAQFEISHSHPPAHTNPPQPWKPVNITEFRASSIIVYTNKNWVTHTFKADISQVINNTHVSFFRPYTQVR